jgi:hypothetical protein
MVNYSKLNSTYCNSRGVPTNMSVQDCKFPKMNEFDKYDFKKQIEPRNLSGYNTLNPNTINNIYDDTFKKINNDGKINYVSTDPRLISAYHNGQVLYLDKPPINGNVRLDEIKIIHKRRMEFQYSNLNPQ